MRYTSHSNVKQYISNYLIPYFFFKQKTAYEMRISDWSSDVCSSDLDGAAYHLVVPADRAPLPKVRALEAWLLAEAAAPAALPAVEIGRASCRERVCQYV